MDTIFLDIETASNLDAIPELYEYHVERIKPKGGLTDPAKIEKDIEEKRKAISEDAALTAGEGQIVVLGLLSDGGEYDGRGDESEGAALIDLWSLINRMPTLVTFNGLAFDLPYCAQRSWQLGIPVSKYLGEYLNKYRSYHFDILQRWTCGVYGKFTTLKRLCLTMGIKPPEGDGADIPRLYTEGKIDEIIAHNRDDLRAMREIYERMK